MKTLKFMLAAATAIGLASATQAAVDQYASTGFEGLDVGTNVTTGVKDNDPQGSYFYYAGVAEDNESVIAEAGDMTGVARPRGAEGVDAGRAKILQVSTGTDPLMRTYAALSAGQPQDTTLSDAVYVDTLVQFTVTPYTDTVTPGSSDKLMIYLKESVTTNEFGEVTSSDTNLVVVGGFYSANATTAKEYVLDVGPTHKKILPNTWYRLTVKAIPDVSGTSAMGMPGFAIWVDGEECVLDTYTMDDQDPIGGAIIAANLDTLYAKKQVLSLLTGSGMQTATLQGVGFAGEGKVDDVMFNTTDPFAALLDFTLAFDTTAGVSAVTYTVNGHQYDQADSYSVEAGSVVEIVGISYDEGYLAGSVTPVNMTNTEGAKYTVDAAGASLTVTATLGAASVGGTTYADVTNAFAAATAGQTVKLFQDASMPAFSTAASTIDLNNNTLTLSGGTAITFTGTGAATLKGGDLTGVYHELDITAPAGENLTFDGMTFHASVKPNGSGDLFTATNCQFLCDCDKTGAAFADGSSADVHSYGVMFNSNSLFAQADIVDSYFDQGRRAAVQASIAGDLYFYGNTVVADKLTSRVDGADTRYPALQIISNGRVFIENNSFSGQYLGEAFCVYNKGTYRTTGAPIVFSGNTVANDVTYLWGIYDVDASGADALVNPDIYFGANTIGANVDLEHCIYKTTVDGIDMNGVTYTYAQNLALPAGVDSVYAWTHAAGATDFYVNGTAAADLTSVAANDTVIAVPGATVTEPAAILLTADAPLKNQYTAATAVAQITGGAKYATLKDAVDAADTGDTVTTLADCSVTNGNVGITFTKGINLVNNYTITIDGANYALRIANGTTTPVTWSGTGSLVWANGSGSPILVGCNEIKSSYGINAFCEGSFVLNGGTLTSTYKTAKGGNLVKLEAGTFVLNDGTINGGTRGVKADSEGNNATCVLTINGGTIVNTNSAAIAASTAGSGSSTVVVNGGTFTGAITGAGMVTIPGLVSGVANTAKFDRDQSAFCASGYETTLADGWYVVTAVQAAGWVDDPTTVSNMTAAAAYPVLDGTALANADAQELTVWAKANSVAFNDATTTPADYVEAFLLNCAATPAAVAAEKEAFVLDITVNADGSVTVSLPDGKNYNGTLQMKGSADLTTWTNVSETSSTYKFYKYELSL